MYKDDLEAARARADAAEVRAEKAEKSLKNLTKVPKEPMWRRIKPSLTFFKHWKIVVICLCVFFSVSFCGLIIHVGIEDGERTAALEQCVISYCGNKCSEHANLVTFKHSWVHRDYHFACTCYLEKGVVKLHFKIPSRCQKFLPRGRKNVNKDR